MFVHAHTNVITLSVSLNETLTDLTQFRKRIRTKMTLKVHFVFLPKSFMLARASE